PHAPTLSPYTTLFRSAAGACSPSAPAWATPPTPRAERPRAERPPPRPQARASVLLLRRHHRVQQRLHPVLALEVVKHEVAGELPVQVGEAALLRGAGDGPGPQHPVLHRRLVVGAVLAQQDRAAVPSRPGLDLVEVALDLRHLRRREAHAGL